MEMPENDFGLEDWKERFEVLQAKALEYGVTSMVILSQEDPLAKNESITYSHRGSVIRLLGMLTHTWRNFNSKLFGSS